MRPQYFNETEHILDDCKICQGRGFTLEGKTQKKCICQVKKELELFLKPVVHYVLTKDTDFSQFPIYFLATGGSPYGFGSLVKSYLFKYYFEHPHRQRKEYELTTGIGITEKYLNPERTHTELYDIPLLFVDLTRYYTNKAMGGIVLYTLEHRMNARLPFWVYAGHMNRDQIEEIYGTDLKTLLLELERVNINNYTKSVEG